MTRDKFLKLAVSVIANLVVALNGVANKTTAFAQMRRLATIMAGKMKLSTQRQGRTVTKSACKLE